MNMVGMLPLIWIRRHCLSSVITLNPHPSLYHQIPCRLSHSIAHTYIVPCILWDICMGLSHARGCQQIINNHVKGELKFRSTISLCFCETFKNYLLFYPSPFTSVRSYRLSLSLHVWTEVAAVHLTLETIEVELTLAGRTTGCRARAGRWAGQRSVLLQLG